jgi:hypothetical protein
METQTFTFASSPFVTIAIVFWGVVTACFIWHVLRLLHRSDHPETCRRDQRSRGLAKKRTPTGTVVAQQVQA